DAYAYAMFMERQMMKAKSGGVARSATYQPLREQAEQLYQQGMKKKEIALMLGVSDRTVRNWLN
ncbi:terminase gpP N-terminus-related DNA-binding protein, partial [Acinetobacter baumannii]